MGGRILTWAEGIEVLGWRGLREEIAHGSLVSRYPGVYAPRGHLGPWLNELEAIVKWAGPGTLASHQSAALLHSLDLLGRCEFEVTVPRERNPRPPSGRDRERVLVHRSTVPERERRILSGIPSTSLAWTCLDLAATLDPVALAVAVESAWRKKPNDLLDWLGRLVRENRKGRRRLGLLEAVLADCAARGKPMRSAFEVQLWLYLISRRRELELPIPGHWLRDAVGKMELDFAWLRPKVAVETNGWGVHGTWKAFNSDADRASRLAALGWRIIPVTYRMFEEAPDAVFDRIRTTVALAEAGLAA